MEDIVISGIAGHLPECENVEQFWEALYEGKDLLTVDDRRYMPGKKHTSIKTCINSITYCNGNILRNSFK